MSLQYNVEQKNIFTKSRIDILRYHYSDLVDAENCFNRLIRNVRKDLERYYECQITINNRASQIVFKEIKSTR